MDNSCQHYAPRGEVVDAVRLGNWLHVKVLFCCQLCGYEIHRWYSKYFDQSIPRKPTFEEIRSGMIELETYIRGEAVKEKS